MTCPLLLLFIEICARNQRLKYEKMTILFPDTKSRESVSMDLQKVLHNLLAPHSGEHRMAPPPC